MPTPNRTFDLSVEDLDLIEAALRRKKRALNEAQLVGAGTRDDAAEQLKDIHDLLGRLHNQKTFYRPKQAVYVSG
ncbi:hypothetical protein PM03_12320 [Thalassobacter stenotrophicus]|uniref:hypothetical protein n=1 Tax=Thalassobacter TaxID=266808 RepID=UPI00051DF158|nr:MULTISPECIES: hypothetical protein [Thalassobacter]KGK78782.1 hypothetical protein PM03_12320 [Thalassobacter stenotrophicus]KGL00868.1 hypothetical protein PM04_11870 [Thalassobacter sp. 16PALIMAR09]